MHHLPHGRHMNALELLVWAAFQNLKSCFLSVLLHELVSPIYKKDVLISL